MQYHNLIPVIDKELYPLLWKSSNTVIYLIAFLNAYFSFHGKNRITTLTILSAKDFTKNSDVKRRIHVSFKQEKKTYFYEIKFSDDTHNENKFDASFLDFAKYYWNQKEEGNTYKIGQIILNFKEGVRENPIAHYYLKNEKLEPMEDSFDIHILYLSSLNQILQEKSYYELNLFERWIRLLQCKTVDEGRSICMGEKDMLDFLSIWNYHSKRIQYKRLSHSTNDTITYSLEKNSLEIKRKIAKNLLQAGCTVSFVEKVVELKLTEIEKIKRTIDKKEGIKDAT